MRMIIAVLTLSTCTTSLKAQNLSFGPTAGFGHGYLSIEKNTLNNKFLPAYNAGGKLVYSFKANWGISADISFSGEGGMIRGNIGSDVWETRWRANYIRLPLQGIYFFGKSGDPIRPKLSLGPSLGFLVGGKSVQHVNDVHRNTVETKDLFEGFDLGLNAAAGANFRLGGEKWLNTDFTYYRGLLDVSQGGAATRNRHIGINVGITFPVGNVSR